MPELPVQQSSVRRLTDLVVGEFFLLLIAGACVQLLTTVSFWSEGLQSPPLLFSVVSLYRAASAGTSGRYEVRLLIFERGCNSPDGKFTSLSVFSTVLWAKQVGFSKLNLRVRGSLRIC